jgi:translation elongation factor P/translation initiation factor 5A
VLFYFQTKLGTITNFGKKLKYKLTLKRDEKSMKSVKELNKGDYIVYRGEPCRVLKKENVTYSTHCHTKVRVDVQGVFTNFKDVLTLLPHAAVKDADITLKRGQLVSKLMGKAQLMDLVSYETVEADIDPELLNDLNEGEELTFVDFNGKIKVLEKRQ